MTEAVRAHRRTVAPRTACSSGRSSLPSRGWPSCSTPSTPHRRRTRSTSCSSPTPGSSRRPRRAPCCSTTTGSSSWALELALPADGPLGESAALTLDALDFALPAAIEIPRVPGWRDALDTIAADGAERVKFRTGGLTAAAHPTEAELAERIVASVRVGRALQAHRRAAPPAPTHRPRDRLRGARFPQRPRGHGARPRRRRRRRGRGGAGAARRPRRCSRSSPPPTRGRCAPASPRSAPAPSTSPSTALRELGMLEDGDVVSCWVPGADGSGYVPAHLPYGVVSHRRGPSRARRPHRRPRALPRAPARHGPPRRPRASRGRGVRHRQPRRPARARPRGVVRRTPSASGDRHRPGRAAAGPRGDGPARRRRPAPSVDGRRLRRLLLLGAPRDERRPHLPPRRRRPHAELEAPAHRLPRPRRAPWSSPAPTSCVRTASASHRTRTPPCSAPPAASTSRSRSASSSVRRRRSARRFPRPRSPSTCSASSSSTTGRRATCRRGSTCRSAPSWRSPSPPASPRG